MVRCASQTARWLADAAGPQRVIIGRPGAHQPRAETLDARQLDRLLRMADGTRSGVILMHDVHPTTRDMLPALLDELLKRGYTFQTLEDYAKWRWGFHVFDRFH